MGALGSASVGHIPVRLEEQTSDWYMADDDLKVPVAGVDNLKKKAF